MPLNKETKPNQPTRSKTYYLFSQRHRVCLIFKQRCQVTISSWIKILSTLLSELAFTVMTWYTNCCITFYISFSNKEINFFIFCSTIVNIVFSSITISTLKISLWLSWVYNRKRKTEKGGLVEERQQEGTKEAETQVDSEGEKKGEARSQ